jgi:CubicO group peptidase (beta-lactamase class C family)
MSFSHYWTKPDSSTNALIRSAPPCRQSAAFLRRFVANLHTAFVVKRILSLRLKMLLSKEKNMLKRCLVFTALILLTLVFTATDILGQQGMTAKTQTADDGSAKKVDAFLSPWDTNDLPGCSVGVVKDGRLVYKRGFGMANLDYDVPNTPSTLFNLWGSNSPQLAALRCMGEQVHPQEP